MTFCIKYMDKMKSKDHPLHFLLPRPLFNQPQYNLKKNADRFYLFIESITGRTKRADWTFLHFDILTSMINFYYDWIFFQL